MTNFLKQPEHQQLTNRVLCRSEYGQVTNFFQNGGIKFWHIWGIWIFGFAVLVNFRSVFGFGVHCGLGIFCLKAFGYQYSSKSQMGFQIWYPMWFWIFPILVPVFFRSERQLWFWIAAKSLYAPLVTDCIGLIRVLITGMWKFFGFDGCEPIFCGFAVLDDFFFAALRVLINPTAPIYLEGGKGKVPMTHHAEFFY